MQRLSGERLTSSSVVAEPGAVCRRIRCTSRWRTSGSFRLITQTRPSRVDRRSPSRGSRRSRSGRRPCGGPGAGARVRVPADADRDSDRWSPREVCTGCGQGRRLITAPSPWSPPCSGAPALGRPLPCPHGRPGALAGRRPARTSPRRQCRALRLAVVFPEPDDRLRYGSPPGIPGRSTELGSMSANHLFAANRCREEVVANSFMQRLAALAVGAEASVHCSSLAQSGNPARSEPRLERHQALP